MPILDLIAETMQIIQSSTDYWQDKQDYNLFDNKVSEFVNSDSRLNKFFNNKHKT